MVVLIFLVFASGLIKDETGSYDLMFYVAIVASGYITLSTVLIAYCIRRAKRRGYVEIEPDLSQSFEIADVKNNHKS